jgi:hypothetical protein
MDFFRFSEAEAVIKGKILPIYNSDKSIEAWKMEEMQSDLAGNVKVKNAYFLIDFTGSDYNAPMKLVMDVTVKNSSIPEYRGLRQQTFVRWIAPGTDTLYIGAPYDGDVRLAEMFNLLPDSIFIKGEMRIGREHLVTDPSNTFDPFAPYTFEEDDFFIGDIDLTAPLELRISVPTRIHADVVSIESFDEPLNKVTLYTFSQSTIPLGGTVYLLGGNFTHKDSASKYLKWEYLNRFKLMDPIRIRQPIIDVETGRASEIRFDSLITVIDSAAIDTLRSLAKFNIQSKEEPDTSLWIRQILNLDATPGDVAMFEDDSVTVTVTAEVEYTVNAEDE